MKQQYNEFAWRMGGPQGSGIVRLAGVFGRACASCGVNVFGHREYHSNILGRHSYIDFRISQKPITSHRESPDMMVTFDAESLCRHLPAVADNGVVLFANNDAEVPLERLPFLDVRLKKSMVATLAQEGLSPDTGGLLELARHRGVQTLPVPYSEMLQVLAHECKLSRRQAGRAIKLAAEQPLVRTPLASGGKPKISRNHRIS